VPARRATETKGGGPAVLPGPLDGLDLRGCLVGLDAPARRPGSAERVVTGGDCLLAPEGDRRKARAEVEAWFATNAFALGAPPRPCFDAFDESRGRLVRRRVFACTDRATFATLRDRPGLAAVVAVETVRGAPGRGEARAGIRRHPSGATLPPEALAAAIRNRWRAEDGPRRVPDVVFREDASRVRERDAAREPAPLRKIAPNLARADTTLGASLKGERGYAGRDDASTAAPIAG
jgi:predicted transposase YbfD/YdcC